jgi:peptide/nickel transport system ATP-binding protein
MTAARHLLTIDDLSVAIGIGTLRHAVIERVSLTVAKGETVALVGESGSGKSMTARAIMGLLPPGLTISSGTVHLDGEDLAAKTPRQMNDIRGRRIGMLFQQPQSMLDPTCRVGQQVAESLRKHRGLTKAAARARVVELLRDVGIADPEQRARAYAHELSGGLAQRVMIAAALAADPDLLIADEPTTALDVTMQAQILRLLDDQQRKRQMAILFISHDLSMVSAFASRVAVMYAGRIVEEGPTARVLQAPRHPYTQALAEASLMRPDNRGALVSIRGADAPSQHLHRGCKFHPRCDAAHTSGRHDDCRSLEPKLQTFPDGTKARCWAASGHNAEET